MSEASNGLVSQADLALAATASFFAELPLTVVRALLEGATIRRFEAPGLLFAQGDPANRFFVVLEGMVKLSIVQEDGSQAVVEVIEPVGSFGEAAMFALGSFPVMAETGGGTRMIQVSASRFLRRLREDPQLSFQVLAGLARWEERLVRQLESLKLQSPAKRLSSYLLRLTEASGANKQTITLPLDKSVIASIIGVTPESLSRLFARLAPLGVETHRREIIIRDVAALRDFCGEPGETLSHLA